MNTPSAMTALPLIFLAFIGVMILFTIAGLWAAFAKAGQPGWACIVPVYNLFVMTRIAGKSGWWVLLVILPCVGPIFNIVLTHSISKAFGYGALFTLGLVLLPFVFWPILGFGDAEYQGAG